MSITTSELKLSHRDSALIDHAAIIHRHITIAPAEQERQQLLEAYERWLRGGSVGPSPSEKQRVPNKIVSVQRCPAWTQEDQARRELLDKWSSRTSAYARLRHMEVNQ